MSKIVPRGDRIRSSLVEDHPVPIAAEDLGEIGGGDVATLRDEYDFRHNHWSAPGI